MHHSLKIKILDLDHIESIVEQDITDVEAEKIVAGKLSGSGSKVVFPDNKASQEPPIHIPPLCAWLIVKSINLLNQADCPLQTFVNLKDKVEGVVLKP